MIEFLKRLESLPWEEAFDKIKCVRELKKMLLNWQTEPFYSRLDESGEMLNQVYHEYNDFERFRVNEVRVECKNLCEKVVDCYSKQICYGQEDETAKTSQLQVSQVALRSIQELHIRLLTLECDLEKLLAIELDRALVEYVFYKHKLASSSFKQIKHDIDEGFTPIFVDYYPNPEQLFVGCAEVFSILADKKLSKSKLKNNHVFKNLSSEGVIFLLN